MRSYRKKVKTKFVWTKELVILIVALLAMIATTIILVLPSKQDKFLEKWSQASLTKETVIVETSKDNVINMINNKESFFVFYGTPESEDSITNIAIVEEFAQKYEVEVVYWLSSAEIYSATEEEKNQQTFINKVDEMEKQLKVKDLNQTTAFFAYENGETTSDTTALETGTFKQEVNNAFGRYYSNNQSK